MSKEIKSDVLKVAIGNFSLGAIMVCIFALLGYFSHTVVLGALLGCSYVSLSFLWLALSVSKNVERDPENARKKVSSTYTLRLLAAAIVVFIAIKAPVFNVWAVIIPLFYQRFVIMAVGRIRSGKDAKKEVVSE